MSDTSLPDDFEWPSPAEIYRASQKPDDPGNLPAVRRLLEWTSAEEMERLRRAATHNRNFVLEIVRLLREKGISQFIDIGSGLPTDNNVHQVAQEQSTEARVVYVDNDPAVITEASSLIVGDPNTGFVLQDIRDVDRIFGSEVVGDLIDLNRPVAVLAFAVMHFIPDDDDPSGIVRSLMDHVPPGSYFGFTHSTSTGSDPDVIAGLNRLYQGSPAPGYFRPRDDIYEIFFAGQDLTPVGPGLTDVTKWPVDPTTSQPSPLKILGGLLRKDE